MNKQSPEYIRVREEIAKELALFDNWNWEGLDKETVRFNQGNTQQIYLKRADSILEIKGIGIIADNQDKPINHWGNDYGIAQHDMEVVGFKRLVE